MTHIAKYIWEDEDEARRREAREERERREYRPSKKEERVEAYPWESQSEARHRESLEKEGKSGFHDPIRDSIAVTKHASVYVNETRRQRAEALEKREKARRKRNKAKTEALSARTERLKAENERSEKLHALKIECEKNALAAKRRRLELLSARTENADLESKLEQKRKTDAASRISGRRPKPQDTKQRAEKTGRKTGDTGDVVLHLPSSFDKARNITPKK